MFNAQPFLDCSGVARKVLEFGRAETVFTQDDACEHVFYIRVAASSCRCSRRDGEAVVAMLGQGDFFGAGCLAGQPVDGRRHRDPRVRSCRRQTEDGAAAARSGYAMSDRFISHMLSRNIRIEEDLIDQLFNSSEKRLARTLLLLARYGKQDKPARAVPKVSQETLAKMIGTTPSRVNFFLNKFKRLGFIEYDGDVPLKINNSLLSVVLHD
jgi:CRP-like cAMP-binding protein